MQPITRRRAISTAAVVGALALTMLQPANADRVRAADHVRDRVAALGKKVITRKIAPGLKYTKIVQKKIPRRTFVLTVDPAAELSIDPTLTQGALPARRILSQVVKVAGALAGVNGDFGSFSGTPTHPAAQDGELVRTSSQLGTLFALSADEATVHLGRPDLSVTVTDQSSERVFEIDRWNDGPPAPGELVGYSPIGGTLEPPPGFACSVRLLPAGPYMAAPEDGVNRDFVVDVAQCSDVPLPRNGGIVLAAPPATDEATQLLALAPGTPMRLHWTFGWPDVLDAIGGAPLLLQDGAILGQCNSACGPQPRTGVGVTASGKILLVVVDGRQPRWSLGPSVTEFAAIMKDLGAVTALNLDGGGSSEMVVNGQVVNRPSDGRERSIVSAILVLPGPDPNDPTG
jgi:Phosphodiester glycosidase